MSKVLRITITTIFTLLTALSIAVYMFQGEVRSGVGVKHYDIRLNSDSLNLSDLDRSGKVLGDDSGYEIDQVSKPVSVITKIVNQVKISAEPYTSIHQVEDLNYRNRDFGFDEQIITARHISSLNREISYNNPNNDKEVMGFVPYWKLSDYREFEYDKLSSISYFSLTCYDNGQWVTDDAGYSGFYSSNFVNMVNLAHQNNVRVYLVVKNFHNRSIRDLVANTGGAGDVLINNIVNVIRANNLDGVNIDFEYIPDSSYPVTASLRSNFAAWHDKLADRMHSEFPGSVVSTDVFGSSAVGTTAYDMRALGATSLDYVMMMTYDYITTSCWDGKKAAPMSPLYGNNLYGTPNWNVSSHVNAAAALMPAGKLLMGIPYYGMDLIVKQADFSKYNALASYPTCDGLIETYGSIVDPQYDTWHNASTIKWNNTEKATWYAYNYSGTYRHGYYDDPNSLSAKYDYVRDAKLGGVGIWVLGYDSGTSDLYNVLRDKFQVTPFIVAFKSDVSGSRVSSIMSSSYVTVVEELGNNVWRVKPSSGLSSDAIKRLRKYYEVQVAEFENVSVGRDISRKPD